MVRIQIPDDETLRQNRLVFYEDDIQEIDVSLEAFLERSKSNCVLLMKTLMATW